MHIQLRDFGGLKNIDVIGLLCGYKKIISTGIAQGRADDLKAAFRKYGLLFDILEDGYDYKKQNCTYIISKDPAHIEAALAAYRAKKYDTVGRLLGYPACCVKHHAAGIGRTESDFVRKCRANSGKFFWPINNVLDFDGRIVRGEASISGIKFISLISHNPCSYDCRPSLEIAKANYINLRTAAGLSEAECDYSILAKPVLYADDFNLAILNGVSSPSGVKYSGAAYVVGFREIREQLVSGDKITVRGKDLLVLRKGRTALRKTFPEKPLILPFDRFAVPK